MRIGEDGFSQLVNWETAQKLQPERWFIHPYPPEDYREDCFSQTEHGTCLWRNESPLQTIES